MPRDQDQEEFKPLPPGVIPPKKKSFLDRMFDEKSDGRFVKRLLISMLLIATLVQPFSLIYTAYSGHLPTDWWEWTPALAVLLFLALDWTILPLAYFFATTNKPALKLALGLMIAVVAVGAGDGYFTATERLIAMRLETITKHGLDLERATDEVKAAEVTRSKQIAENDKARTHLDKQRADLNAQIAEKDKQIATAQKSLDGALAEHLKLMDSIKDGCLQVRYICLKPQQEAERARYADQRDKLEKQIRTLQGEKALLNDERSALGSKDGAKVDTADGDVKQAQVELKTVRAGFEAAVLGNQVYRWAGVIYGKSPRNVSPEQANTVLFWFALAAAAGYVVAQIMLSISYYGRNRKGVIESTKVSWSQVVRALRGYLLRKRRGVYRDRTKEVFVPTSERTRVVYVPVNPGGPVPPAEEFVSKPASKVANG